MSPSPTDDWRDRARCRAPGSPGVDFFFAEDEEGIGRARDFCSRCPVHQSCLHAAMDEESETPNKQIFGVRGGASALERVRIRRDTVRQTRRSA